MKLYLGRVRIEEGVLAIFLPAFSLKRYAKGLVLFRVRKPKSNPSPPSQMKSKPCKKLPGFFLSALFLHLAMLVQARRQLAELSAGIACDSECGIELVKCWGEIIDCAIVQFSGPVVHALHK